MLGLCRKPDLPADTAHAVSPRCVDSIYRHGSKRFLLQCVSGVIIDALGGFPAFVFAAHIRVRILDVILCSVNYDVLLSLWACQFYSKVRATGVLAHTISLC